MQHARRRRREVLKMTAIHSISAGLLEMSKGKGKNQWRLQMITPPRQRLRRSLWNERKSSFDLQPLVTQRQWPVQRYTNDIIVFALSIFFFFATRLKNSSDGHVLLLFRSLENTEYESMLPEVTASPKMAPFLVSNQALKERIRCQQVRGPFRSESLANLRRIPSMFPDHVV